MTEHSSAKTSAKTTVQVERISDLGKPRDDWVVVEEPLEIQIQGRPFAVTMRTPGNDRELALGLLFAEGVIHDLEDVVAAHCAARDESLTPSGSCLSVELTEPALDRWARWRVERELLSTSACGVCGKPSLEDLARLCVDLPRVPALGWDRGSAEGLVQAMAEEQKLFRDTGGAHAASAFDRQGRLLATFEDIGRHNALDKLIGRRLLDGADASGCLLTVSGRAGFELVQKAIRARAAALIAVGAASSLAVSLADRCGLELLAFVGAGRGNRHVQSGPSS